ncbi:MAG: putative phosphohistidine phosphatase, SixA [Flavipsychrobacter sp.]|jgi:phosphohistidine phosphatase|nr:putative phosphohistidine phosphatase, SixA [Flavipsychrobacter sp.]
MERTLVMIRHAKSSWANPLQSDFERPLNDRGEHDAPMMGERLKKNKLIPDLIIASTAKRAKQTAKKIAKEVGYDHDKIVWNETLYHCIPSVFEEVLYEVDDNTKTVFIVGHNPGITDFVNHLSSKFKTDIMPTCGIVACKFDAQQWNEFNGADKKVFLFDYPKKEI